MESAAQHKEGAEADGSEANTQPANVAGSATQLFAIRCAWCGLWRHEVLWVASCPAPLKGDVVREALVEFFKKEGAPAK